MPIKTSLWKVGKSPQVLHETKISSEQLLEDMIVREPRLLSEEWLLIGRQERTAFGGIIDLLALAPDASLILIELKRGRTPREVVAQSLDYASWVESLQSDHLSEIFRRFQPGEELSTVFEKKFGCSLDEENLNQSHQIVIVAAELDASTERIVAYLNSRDVAINVLYFQVFSNGDEQILSRTWLLDPIETQVAASASRKVDNEPWNGEFYCSFGESQVRSWREAVKHGFVCGGGGAWYSRTLQLLAPGDRVWVKVPGRGFVGVGIVTGGAQPAGEFTLSSQGELRPALEVLTEGGYHREFVEDKERCEYFVPMKWLDTKSLDQAVSEVGMFGNQNTVCKPTSQKWRATVERLKVRFPNFSKHVE